MPHERVYRWKKDRPPSLEAFMARFPDDWSCAAYLADKRWPDGFVCPHCGGRKGWKLKSKPWVWECGGEAVTRHGEIVPCRRQTSVIAGTVMHGTRLPLRTWFLAAHLVATHSNGISALQLQAKLGIGSYKTAWLLLHKLRRAMVNPDREPLSGVVEIDETSIPFRRGDDPVAGGGGRSHIGRLMIIGAVEHREDGRSGRIRLARIRAYDAATIRPFVLDNTEPGSTIVTDGHGGYVGIPDREHDPRTVGRMAAHVLFERIHRVFSLMKRWAMGVYHGLRERHLNAYLQEYVFRWNRRRSYRSSFDTLLGIGMRRSACTYYDVVGRRPFFRELKRWVRGKSREARQWAYERAIRAGVAPERASRLLDPVFPPSSRRRRRKPRRPVLAPRRTAFAVEAY